MTGRSTPEWIGKKPDTAIPPRVKERVLTAYGNKCAISGIPFSPSEKPEFDHIQPLKNGGENRESNLQPLTKFEHKKKTGKDMAIKKKNERVRKKHLGIETKKATIAGGKGSRFKRKVDGTVVLRDAE